MHAGSGNRFKKPRFDDSEDVDVNEQQSTAEVPKVVFNPLSSYPLKTQRERLPVFQHRREILYLLENFQVLILTGETGSGKSTQVPQYLHEAGWSTTGLIGVSQPRRVACINLAKRVAEETGQLLGQVAGYTVRFDNCVSKQTRIKYLTEGILINEIQADPLLTNYSVLILDEAHEMSLLMDICLGLLKKILRRRKDLKLIVSSATLDADKIKRYFTNKSMSAEILNVQGRTYPITIFYAKDPVADYVKASADTVQKIHETQPAGHILVFLTGEKEVDDCCSMLRDYAVSQKQNKLFILPLYAALPAKDQMKVFEPTSPQVRKVIVATNIAETSVTINGVVYVVDCGYMKMTCYNLVTGTDTLLVTPTSKCSAMQRAGRAGRIGPGKVYRLYNQEAYASLREFNIPEMQRSNLTWTVLLLKSLGVDNIVRFDYMSPPPSKILVNAVEILHAHEALDREGKMTQLGTKLIQFKCDVLQAKILLKSIEFGCSSEMLTIVAMMQLENIFAVPKQKTRDIKKAQYQFFVEEGDLLSLLNIYTSFVEKQKSKQWCYDMFVNYKSLCKVAEIRNRLKEILIKISGDETLSSSHDPDDLCRCIASGYFTNAAYWHAASAQYRSICGDHPLEVHPDSAFFSQRPPKFVVFGKVIATHKLLINHITAVKQSWLIDIAPEFYQMGTAVCEN
ncbi:putative ATP-dependent RNA helicase DHX35-like [Tropilaelaps mercedesae]|uniref:RNA helicase n=1 Tax=Tropilaelaps mercedesae TaxID=418985 RepID=A0A1V9XTE8_9ACAR|nr:putative ATP-dependent RNA helicase DHX35-like [Tropilaelaps mercedesae]